MNKPTEKHIEQYVLNRSELTEMERKWIQNWIESDEKIHLLTEWYQKFYKNLERIESAKDKVVPQAHVISLKPVTQKSKYSGSVFVLAAQTPIADRKQKTLKTIQTFVSEENKTLIRILHDSSMSQTKLHVISEFLLDDDIVLIDIADQKNTTLVSKPGGTVVISDQEFPENSIKAWEKCKLHLPISRVEVFKDEEQDTLNFDTTETHFEREELSLLRHDDVLQISFKCSIEEIPDKMVFHAGDKSSMWPVENGKCSIDIQYFSDFGSSLFFYK